MRTDQPFDLSDGLVALGVDRRACRIHPSERPTTTADWILGAVIAAEDSAVHADYWERHPAGDEILHLLSGRLSVTLAPEGATERCCTLRAGEALVVPCGVWHRLQVLEPARLLFITPPRATEHRPRERAAAAPTTNNPERDNPNHA